MPDPQLEVQRARLEKMLIQRALMAYQDVLEHLRRAIDHHTALLQLVDVKLDRLQAEAANPPALPTSPPANRPALAVVPQDREVAPAPTT